MADGVARCACCSRSFTFDLEDYQARGYAPPKLCVGCRAARAARCVEVTAVVDYATPKFIFARDAAGMRYYISPGALDPRLADLDVGARVVLSIDPEAAVPPGQRPRALRVRLEQ